MRPGADLLLIALLLPNFVFLGSGRIPVWIRALSLQGFLLGVLPLAVHSETPTLRVAGLALMTAFIKGGLLPRLLERAMIKAEVRREVEPFVGFSLSIAIGMACLGGSAWLSSRLPLPHRLEPSLCVTLAFFHILIGLFLIISRKKALTQALGYLVMENGIYIFGVSFALATPVLVEFGILLDVLVAAFVMGIMIFHISQTFDHIDTDQLNLLKD